MGEGGTMSAENIGSEKLIGSEDQASFVNRVAMAGEEGWAALWEALTPIERRRLFLDWRYWRQAGQAPPAGRWRNWLLMAGRGFGKTRVGAEWVRRQAQLFGTARIALVGATMAEARAIMVEGESGLLAICRDRQELPTWEPSLNRLRWPSGASAYLYSASEPNSLRGPQHTHAWADEIGKWAGGEDAWNNLQFGLRIGPLPRAVVTTTPSAVPLVKRLVTQKNVAVTCGRTADNHANLSADFLQTMTELHGGTRLGRQELDGELIEDSAGAMWPRDLVEACRVERPADADLGRVVIGVDPPAGIDGAACGIVAAGVRADGKAVVLADCSIGGVGPEGWAAAVASARAANRASLVVAEANQGGAMVESVLRACETHLPLRLVHARVGKGARAEPVAALFRSGKALFGGCFPELEDELAGFVMGAGWTGVGSPDRADAMVWALTELMLSGRGEPSIRLVG
jgi:phage terminase large subunit-like protein